MKSYYTQSPFGEMLIIENGNLSFGITTEFGIRISRICAFGFDNICFFDEKFSQTKTVGDVKWLQLGGHRLWRSPECDECYLYDNTAAETVLFDNGAEFTAKRGDGLIFSIKIEFLTENSARVTHTAKNTADKAVNLSLWGITALRHGGKILIPLDTTDTGLLPNRNIVFWSYTDINDNRLRYTNNGIEISADKNLKPLKVGAYNKSGKIFYADRNIIFTKSFDAEQTEKYPDFGCNIECYTDGAIIEMETLSPKTVIKPNETAVFQEIWQFEKK
ncbi:MAG TPA: hypothetical protein P5087_06240 [Eubacteriales bacterium]|nr:hypothetical protein [Eubacteriales bacterium]